MSNEHSIMNQTIQTDVVIIGAGASGLFCAMTAGQRGRRVLIIDHASRAGLKILMSGGGRCNFTNYFVEAENYTGDNPHFCKSALSRYSNWDFISLVEKHGIAYHEKSDGQLFCDHSAKDIVNMLLAECQQANVTMMLKTQVMNITAKSLADSDAGFIITCQKNSKKTRHHPTDSANSTDGDCAKTSDCKTEDEGIEIHCQSLVIATGGLSIPTKGATGFGYQVAEQFGHQIVATSAGLVPFTFTGKLGEMFASLSGLSLDVIAFNERIRFAKPLLFTHRGLSGFAMLQLSNYWQTGESIHLNLFPNTDVTQLLINAKQHSPKQKIRTILADYLPKKLLLALQDYFWYEHQHKELANIKDSILADIGSQLNDWEIKPSGTEGYRTAEVTLGGVATSEVSSKTFESQRQPNLYFIGEVLDVTGWLGGYNFQWAWASGYACGQAV